MNDQSQFLELYFAHEQELRTYIRALLRSRSEYEDVFQVVVMTLWRKFDTYDPSRPFGAWARGVAAKEVFEAHRQDGRRPTPFSPESVHAIIDSFDRKSPKSASGRLDALDRCIRSLPTRLRNMLMLRYEDGLPMGEIAERVGRTAVATQRQLSRIRHRLLECIRRRLGATPE